MPSFFAASSDEEEEEEAAATDELKEYLALPQIKYRHVPNLRHGVLIRSGAATRK